MRSGPDMAVIFSGTSCQVTGPRARSPMGRYNRRAIWAALSSARMRLRPRRAARASRRTAPPPTSHGGPAARWPAPSPTSAFR